MTCYVCANGCSDCAQDLLERVLKTASFEQILSFLCFICKIPHKNPHLFKTMDPSVSLLYSGQPPTLHIEHSRTRSSDSQDHASLPLAAMESTSQHVVKLLESDVGSESVTGAFFVECLSHLAAVLPHNSNKRKYDTGSTNASEATVSSCESSSALLDCEHLMPMTISEMTDRTSTLYITAALCEHMGAKVISQVHLPSLLTACGGVLSQHAGVLEERGRRVELSVQHQSDYGEEMVGGTVSLTLVFGLLSAIMSGAREVSDGENLLF